MKMKLTILSLGLLTVLTSVMAFSHDGDNNAFRKALQSEHRAQG